jgi:cobalt/nickel transport system permease protein
VHLPDSLLQGPVCPITAAVASTALAGTLLASRGANDRRPTAPLFTSTTALLAAAQMVNIPVLPGVSGHLVGGVLATRLLGIRFGILSMATVVILQALLLGDGGIHVLGANLCNMALVATGFGGLLDRMMRTRMAIPSPLSAAIASWISVVAATIVLGSELVVGGTLPAASLLPALLGVHLLIGLGESLLTVALLQAGNWKPWSRPALPWAMLALVFLGLTPLSSSLPDGLEWAMNKAHSQTN